MAKDIREDLNYTKGVRNPDLYKESSEEPTFDFDDSPQTDVPPGMTYLGGGRTKEYEELLKERKKEKEAEDWERAHYGEAALMESVQAKNRVMNAITGIFPDVMTSSSLDIRGGIGDYGKYKRERKDSPNLNSTITSLMDKRAELQPAIDKIFNGTMKGVITAATTFINGLGGVTWGLLTSPAAFDDTIPDSTNIFDEFTQDRNKNVDENGVPLPQNSHWDRVWQRLWSNEVTNAMKAVQDWAEKALPNYYTEKERTNKNYYDNFFTANFWGDKFIKNLGFTVGAFYSGKVISGLLSGLAEMGTGGRYAVQAVGSLASATGEGIIEALTNAKEWEKLEIMKANDEYVSKIRELKSKYGDSTDVSNLGMLQQVAANELKQLKANYQQRIARIKTDSAHVGNTILAWNIPILTASNLIRFSRAYVGNYNPFTHWNKKHTAVNKTPGVNRYAYKPSSFWSELGIKEGKITDALSFGVKNFVAEGAEEWFQRAASNLGTLSGTQDINNFLKYGSDYKWSPSFLEYLGNMWRSVEYTASETGANGSWEEFFIGGLTGLLGVPGFRSFRNSETGKFQSPITLQESTLGKLFSKKNEFKEKKDRLEGMLARMNEFYAEAGDKKSAAEYLERYLQGTNIQEYIKGLKRHWFIEDDALKKGKEGDKLAYQNSRLQQLISDIIMFRNTGQIKDFKTILKGMIEKMDLSEDNVQAIIEATSDTIDGKKLGPFIKEDGTEQMSGEEISKIVKANVENIMSTIDRISDTANTIINNSYGKIQGEQLDNLVFLKEMYNQYLDRAKENVPAILSMFKAWKNNLVQMSRTLSEDATEQDKETQKNINSNIEVLDKIIEVGERAVSTQKEGAIKKFLSALSNREIRNHLILFSFEDGSNTTESISEKYNTTEDALTAGMYMAEYNKLFNKYLSAEEFEKDVKEVDKEEESVAENETTNESLEDLKERIEERKKEGSSLGFSDIEELVQDASDLDKLKAAMEKDDSMKEYIKFIDDIKFKRGFINFLGDNIENDEVRDSLIKLVNGIKDFGNAKSLKDALTKARKATISSILGNISAFKVEPLLTALQGALKKYSEEEKEAKKEDKEKTKKPEKPAPAPEKKKNEKKDLSKSITALSKNIQQAVKNGEDLAELFDENRIDDLKEYAKALARASKTDSNFSEEERKEKEFILEEIEAAIKRRNNPQTEDAVPVSEKDKEQIENEITAKELKEEEEKNNQEIKEGVFKNWVTTVWNFITGKYAHTKQLYEGRDEEENLVWESFNIQDLIDSGDLAKLIKDKQDVLIKLIKDDSNGFVYLAYEADNKELDKIDKEGKKYPRVTSQTEGMSYILVGTFGANSVNRKKADQIRRVVRGNTKNKPAIEITAEGTTFNLKISDLSLRMNRLYSGRFEKLLDEDGNPIYRDLRQIGNGKPILGVVINGEVKSFSPGVQFEEMNKFILNREGTVVVGVRGANGKIYATPVTIKRFIPSSIDRDSNAAQAVMKAIQDFVNTVQNKNSSLKEKMQKLRALKKILYFGEVQLNFNISNNGKVKFKILKSKLDTSPVFVETAEEIFDTLFRNEYNMSFNVSLRGEDWRKALNLGILTSDLNSYNNFNGSFDLVAVNDSGASAPVETSHTGSREFQNKQPDVMILGTRIKVGKGSKKSLENNGIFGISGAEVLKAISDILKNEDSPEGFLTEVKDGRMIYYLKIDTLTDSTYVAFTRDLTKNNWVVLGGQEINDRGHELEKQNNEPVRQGTPQDEDAEQEDLDIATSLRDSSEQPESEASAEASADAAATAAAISEFITNEKGSLEEIISRFAEQNNLGQANMEALVMALQVQSEINKECLQNSAKLTKALQEFLNNLNAPGAISKFETDINCF